MRVVDSGLRPIETYDLNTGHLVDILLIKEDALPVDNITKHAWADDDYEPAKMYVPNKVDSGSPSYHEEIETLKGENETLKSQVAALQKTIFYNI